MRFVHKGLVVYALSTQIFIITVMIKKDKSFSKGPLASVGRIPSDKMRLFLRLRFDSDQIGAIGGDELLLLLLPAPDVVDASLLQDRCSAQPARSAEKVSLSQQNRVSRLVSRLDGWMADGSMQRGGHFPASLWTTKQPLPCCMYLEVHTMQHLMIPQ